MEREPIQKEFGEAKRRLNFIEIRKFGQSTKEQGALKEVVGHVTVEEQTYPVPHYKVPRLDVYKRENQGKGFASQLLSEVEDLSRTSKLPVVLEDGIVEQDNPEAAGMYARRKGWIEVKSRRGSDIRHYIFGNEDDENVQKLLDYFFWK
ncbi:MAG TPA: hypothetical protein VMH91_01550 [Candidatus Paceibacterota bacterium]|nr:hypothetical protein [Candidatus Paceibacterota bacterium]